MQRNSASDIFCLENASSDGNQIFSIAGSPSFRIRRQREANTSVFPSGCMGNTRSNVHIPEKEIGEEMLRDKAPPVVEDVHQPMKGRRQEEPMNYQQYQQQVPQVEPVEYEDPVTRVDSVESVESVEQEYIPESTPMMTQMMPPSYQHKGLSVRNPLTGEGMEEPSDKRGKRASGRRPVKWAW